MKTGKVLETEVVYLNGIRVVQKEDSVVNNLDSSTMDEKRMSQIDSIQEKKDSVFSLKQSEDPKLLNPEFGKKNQEGQEFKDEQRHSAYLLKNKNLESFDKRQTEFKKREDGPKYLNESAPIFKHQFTSERFTKDLKIKGKTNFSSINLALKRQLKDFDSRIENKNSELCTRVYFPNRRYFIEIKKKKCNIINLKACKGILKSSNEMEKYLLLPVKFDQACGGVPFILVDFQHEFLKDGFEKLDESSTQEDHEVHFKNFIRSYLLEKKYLDTKLNTRIYYQKFLAKIEKKNEVFNEGIHFMLSFNKNAKKKIVSKLGLGFRQIVKQEIPKKQEASQEDEKVETKDKEETDSSKNPEIKKNGSSNKELLSSEQVRDSQYLILNQDDQLDSEYILSYLLKLGKDNNRLRIQNEQLMEIIQKLKKN